MSPPKLFLGQNCAGPGIDVWSLGGLLYPMVTGTVAFTGRGFFMLRQRVLRGRLHVPSYRSYECLMILKMLMTVNPSDRATLEN